MKHKWWLVPVALAVIGVFWILASDNAYLEPLQTAVGLRPAGVERAKSKPICSSPVNPNVAAPTDCIPKHLANLPPDPGPAGMATIEGIDSDKDGVRDDVQRFIAEKWGHSERAVRALTMVAKGQQETMLIGDSVSREEAKKLADQLIDRPAYCYFFSVTDESIKAADAAVRVAIAVKNTPQRHARQAAFELLLANTYTEAPTAPVEELCGYNPVALPS